MFNKKLIILILLAIFCIGITISSVSANENTTNDSINSYDFLSDFQKENVTSNIVEENSLSENIVEEENSILKVNDETPDNLEDTKNYVGKLEIWIYEPTPDSYLYSTTTNPLKCGVSLYNNYGAPLFYLVGKPIVNLTVLNQKGNIIYNESQQGEISDALQTSNSFPSNYEILKNVPNGEYTFILSTSDKNMAGPTAGWYSGTTYQWKVNVPSSPPTITSDSSSNKNHYTKYLKVGKYKVPIWSDDSLSVQKQKVLKYLKKHVKKGKTYKFNGFKFKVSKKQYIQILYKNKFKLGLVKFKINTHKFKTIKKPVYKYKKVKNWSWTYLETKNMKEYIDSSGHLVTKYYNVGKYYDNGWKLDSTYIDYRGDVTVYCVKLKKKTNYPTYKLVKTGYKKVKVPVYALGHSSKFVPYVKFRAIGKGFNQYAGSGYYYRLK